MGCKLGSPADNYKGFFKIEFCLPKFWDFFFFLEYEIKWSIHITHCAFFFLETAMDLVCWSKCSTGRFHSDDFPSEEQQRSVPVPAWVKRTCKWKCSFNHVSFYLHILRAKPGMHTALLKSIWCIDYSQTWLKCISASKTEVIQLGMFCNYWIILTSSSLYVFTCFRWWFIVMHEALVPPNGPFWQTRILNISEEGVV